MHAYMHKSSIRDHLPGIDKEAKLFLSRLLQWPEGRELSPEITLCVWLFVPLSLIQYT